MYKLRNANVEAIQIPEDASDNEDFLTSLGDLVAEGEFEIDSESDIVQIFEKSDNSWHEADTDQWIVCWGNGNYSVMEDDKFQALFEECPT